MRGEPGLAALHASSTIWPGKSAAEKRQLSDAIARKTCRVLGYGEAPVSIGFEEASSDAWAGRVYATDIQDKWNLLTKVPGYGPGARAIEVKS